MNCKELAYLLGDYVDGTMEAYLKEELDVHLAECEPCIRFLRTYDRTRELARRIEPERIPEELRERLKSFVMQKARDHYSQVEQYIERAKRERREAAAALVKAYRDRSLTPTLALIFETHRGRCPRCGAFIESLENGDPPRQIPPDVEEHLADFLDSLPPGEVFPLPRG